MGALLGSRDYLKQLARLLDTIPDADTLAPYLLQIEQIERECLGVIHASRLRIDNQIQELEANRRQERLSGEGYNRHLDSYQNHLSAGMIALYLRVMTAHLQCALPVSQQMIVARLIDTEDMLKALAGTRQHIFALLEEQCPEPGKLSLPSFKTAHRENVNERRNSVQDAVNNPVGMVEKYVLEVADLVRETLLAPADEIRIVVELDGRMDVTTAYQIADAVER